MEIFVGAVETIGALFLFGNVGWVNLSSEPIDSEDKLTGFCIQFNLFFINTQDKKFSGNRRS